LMPISDPDFMDFGQPVTGPLVNKGKVKKKKKPFKLIKRKGSPENFDKRKIKLGKWKFSGTRKELEGNFKSDIVAMLANAGIKGGSMKKTKKVLINLLLDGSKQ